MYWSGCAEVASTAVPARLSAILSVKFGYTPLLTGASVAQAYCTAVPAGFAACACTRRCVVECLILTCPVLPCPPVSANLCTRRCVLERLMLRCQVWPRPPVLLHVACTRRWMLESMMLGFWLPRCPLFCRLNLVHTPWDVRAFDAKVSGTAMPAGLSTTR